MKRRMASIGIGVAVVAAMGTWAALSPRTEHAVGSYITTLRGRTESQIFNARLAACKINNRVVQPGQMFSFIRSVGPWTADVGYRKAPVSYDGELINSWGGGVCQVSSTLYNAALLSGLDIVERHRHHWPARYAPLGRDAAVAYEDIDLRFRNNLPSPIRITAKIEGDNLVCSVLSTCSPSYRVRVESEIRSVTLPNEVVQDRAASKNARWRLVNRGHSGFFVVTYRRFISPKGSHREFLSADRYPAMSRIMRVTKR